MSESSKGQRVAFPKERIFVLDIAQAARSVPAFPVERDFRLGDVAAARQLTTCRISWTALFVKAWGIVSAGNPTLRQAYMTWPWRSLYQHPHSVASISVNRVNDQGQNFLIFARIHAPESMSLIEVQAKLDEAKSADPSRFFKDGYDLARWPTPIRRCIWAVMMHGWGRKKAKKLGTFSLSALAGQSAMNRNHPLIVTTSLAYAPLDERGNSMVTLLCDHRTIDGYEAALALGRLQEVLADEILTELRGNARNRMVA